MQLGEPFARGNTAALYRRGERVIKLFVEGSPAGQAASEAEKQRHARSCGLPVPEVYEVTEIGGRQALIMEFVPGETLGSLMLRDGTQTGRNMGLSVTLQRDIHCAPPGELERQSDRLRRQLASASLLGEGQRARLVELLGELEGDGAARVCLCHGDFHVMNVLLDGDRAAIIDWVDASCGDFRADVCRSYLLYTHVSAELAELYLREYCEQSGLARGAALAWLPVLAGARLSERLSLEEQRHLLAMLRVG